MLLFSLLYGGFFFDYTLEYERINPQTRSILPCIPENR
jgi:hypothetical protein